MRRYLKLLAQFFRISLILEMMWRLNFVLTLFIQFAWLALYFTLIHVLFLHTDAIAGWSKRDMILLLGVWSMIDDILEWLVSKNLRSIPSEVESGKFDRALTWPADSQFMSSFMRFDFARFVMLFVDAGIIGYAFSLEHVPWHFSMLFAPLLVLNGTVIGYTILLMLESLAFLFIRVDNLWALFTGIFEITKYPLDVFGRVIKLIALTALPLAIIVMIPAQAFLGRLPWAMVVYAFAVSVVFLWISRKFYLFAVRRYSSVA